MTEFRADNAFIKEREREREIMRLVYVIRTILSEFSETHLLTTTTFSTAHSVRTVWLC
jgi:hypothetical protein